MEVAVPVRDFNFDTGRPPIPQNRYPNNSGFEFHHHRYISAPNSPSTASVFYAAIRGSAANTRGSRHSSVPFDWEERPGTPKSRCEDEKDEFDFALGFSQRHHDVSPPEAAVASADELFELGMIRPLKLPPRLYSPVMGEQGQKSPRNGGLFSPLRRGRNHRGKELDPFAVAMVEATRSRKGSRSLSPFRGRGREFYTPESSPPHPPPTAEKPRRGWKSLLKNLFLFRSSSEGRAAEVKRDDLCKYASSSSLSSSSSSSSTALSKVKKGLGG